MNGEELKQYIKRSGMSVAAVAEELGTSPQNLNAKFNRKSIKIDFFQKIKEIIDKCAPPLPAEMEEAVFGSNINGSNSSNVSQSIGSDAALVRELELLKKMVADKDEEIKFLRAQLSTKISGSV
jgi:transcriptional regulator with XRE-family HTH domain